MPWTSPNAADASFAAQSELFQCDWDILAAAFAGTGVQSGCAVAQRGAGANMSVDVAVGDVMSVYLRASVAAVNVAVTTADATNPRIDLVKVNASGTVAVVAGTPAASPKAPALTSGDIGLAMVYVPAAATSITTNMITDKRVNVDNGGLSIFGDGSDGNVTISGTTTLTRDMFYDTLTVQSGGILNTANFRVYCRTKCDLQAGGIIQCNGGDASANTAGTAVASGTLTAARSGVSGVGGAGAGQNGTTSSPTFGGAGGAGGAAGGGTGAGGNAGTAIAPAATLGTVRAATGAIGTLFGTSSSITALVGAASGGSGGGNTGTSGGGGAGAGSVVLVARQLLLNGTIKAKGGAGGAASVGGNGGGGGGGGGGTILLVYASKQGTGTTDVTGGALGAKDGTGTNGSAGSSGTVFEIVH